MRQLLRRPSSDARGSPARYAAWLAREPWGHGRVPDSWRGRLDPPFLPGARIVAVLHVFYPDLLDEIMSHLTAIPVPFDLIATCAARISLDVDRSRLPNLQRSLVLEVENRGRDLWPLVQLVNAGLLDGYELTVKVHTKRSDWRASHGELHGTGSAWRGALLTSLLGDSTNVSIILSAFETSADLGIVTADDSVLGQRFWGRNAAVTTELVRRTDLRIRLDALTFAAGSMYWARARILRRLADLRLSAADFEEERGQVDGTTAHALERVIGMLTTDAGLRIVERSALHPRDRRTG